MIRLARPDLDSAEMDRVRRVLESGMLIQGDEVAALERAFADRTGVEHAVAVSSGTAALHLALVAAGVGPGDEVILPDYTFVATANAVCAAGAKPILVDVEPDTLNIDPESVRTAVTPRTRAVLPVHQFGLPARMEEIRAIAEEHDLLVVEDAACALGADLGGIPCGHFGLLAAFSLHPRKVMTTAEGGMIVTADADLAERLRALRNHGQRKTDAGTQVVAFGFNYRMSEIHAAIGCVQIEKLADFIAARRARANRYRHQLSDIEGLSLPPETSHGGRHVFQSYVVILPEGLRVADVIPRMRSADIECGPGTTRVGAQPAYAGLARPCPTAETLSTRGLSLPMHTQLTDDDVDRVCEVLRTSLTA